MSRSIIPALGKDAMRQIRSQLAGQKKQRKVIPPDGWAALNAEMQRIAIEFTMPIPPSVNHLFFNTKNGRTKSTEYARYMELATQEIVYVQKVPHLAGEVAVFITIRRFSDLSDLDNRLKGALDAIVAARVIDDDKHIIEIGAKWSKEIDTCRVRIEPR